MSTPGRGRLPVRTVIAGGGRSEHSCDHARTRGQAAAIGALHALAGPRAVVLLQIAALPTRLEAAAALAVVAPRSVASPP